jgi:Protein of unknown function (DUF3592)
MTFAPKPSTVERPGGGRSFRHWDKVFILAVAAAILAVMLYIDHRLDVWSLIPLRAQSSTPLQDFLFVGTFLFPLGALGLLVDLEDVAHAVRSAVWPTVTGKVLSSEVEHHFGKGPQFTARVRYEYQVGGQRFEGFTIHFSQRKFRLAETADQVIRNYPVGSMVDVHYDPNEPATAVLETSPGDAYISMLWSLAFLLAPFLMYFEFFRGVLHG